MSLTEYQAAYFAHELSRRYSLSDSEKLAPALADAQVDLNPHQLDAALFAFQSPLSKGCILADEVGLGKTIEAGLVIAQKWSERKRQVDFASSTYALERMMCCSGNGSMPFKKSISSRILTLK